MVWSPNRQPQTLKNVSSHRDGGCPGCDPRNCPRLSGLGGAILVTRTCRRLMSKILKVPTVTRIVGVLVSVLVSVTFLPVADVKRSEKVPTVTGMVGVLITILVTVTIF